MSQSSTSKTKARWLRWLLLGAAPFALAAIFLPKAFAHGWRKHGHTPEERREHMGMFLEHVLGKVDASDEQVEAADALLDQLVPDMTAMHGEGEELRSKFRAALAKEDLDVEEIEALRAESVSLVDKASKRGVQAVLDLSNVLTPEQRQELLERMEKRRRHRH